MIQPDIGARAKRGPGIRLVLVLFTFAMTAIISSAMIYIARNFGKWSFPNFHTDMGIILENPFIMLAISGAALTILGTAGAFIIGSVLQHSIQRLSEQVKGFAENGSWTSRKHEGIGALGRLEQNLAYMAASVKESQDKKEQLLLAYRRFAPQELLSLIKKKRLRDVTDIDAAIVPMSMLFANIWSFRSVSQEMTPQEIIAFLNSLFADIGPKVRENSGFVARYFGDACMALFPESADNAIRAAVSIQSAMQERNIEYGTRGFSPLRLGIGIHFGKCTLGTILEHEKMEAMVISPAVAFASKLEKLTRKYSSEIIVSGQVLKVAEHLADYHYRFLDKVAVKDTIEPATIYEVYNASEEEQVELRSATKKDFEEALKLFFAAKFQEALIILNRIFSKNPSDRACDLYINRCEYFIAHGVSESWKGVEKTE
jgi:class 3 adenylate cyclase